MLGVRNGPPSAALCPIGRVPNPAGTIALFALTQKNCFDALACPAWYLNSSSSGNSNMRGFREVESGLLKASIACAESHNKVLPDQHCGYALKKKLRTQITQDHHRTHFAIDEAQQYHNMRALKLQTENLRYHLVNSYSEQKQRTIYRAGSR